MKLTLLYIVSRQPCEGAVRTITATQSRPIGAPKLADMMQHFSIVPTLVDLIKRSACWLGVMHVFDLAESYHPDMKSELLVDGFLSSMSTGLSSQLMITPRLSRRLVCLRQRLLTRLIY